MPYFSTVLFVIIRLTCCTGFQVRRSFSEGWLTPDAASKRGFFLLITYSLPLRRTILQSALLLMDALTSWRITLYLMSWDLAWRLISWISFIYTWNWSYPSLNRMATVPLPLYLLAGSGYSASAFSRRWWPVFSCPFSSFTLNMALESASRMIPSCLIRLFWHTIFRGAKIGVYWRKKK